MARTGLWCGSCTAYPRDIRVAGSGATRSSGRAAPVPHKEPLPQPSAPCRSVRGWHRRSVLPRSPDACRFRGGPFVQRMSDRQGTGADPRRNEMASTCSRCTSRVGPAPEAEFLRQMMADLDVVRQELQAAGVVGVRRRPARARTRDRAAPVDGDVLVTDGPYVEGKEHLGGFTIIEVAGPGRRPGVGPAADAAGDARCRSRSGRSGSPDVTRRAARRSSGSSARSTAARSPSWSASSATSTSPRRRSRRRSPPRSQRWPVDGVPPSPAGWIITTARNRAIDRLRREASARDVTPRPRC